MILVFKNSKKSFLVWFMTNLRKVLFRLQKHHKPNQTRMSQSPVRSGNKRQRLPTPRGVKIQEEQDSFPEFKIGQRVFQNYDKNSVRTIAAKTENLIAVINEKRENTYFIHDLKNGTLALDQTEAINNETIPKFSVFFNVFLLSTADFRQIYQPYG